MGKSQNPIDLHKRNQRKKELAKNRSKRLAARDLKVAMTESLKDVTEKAEALKKKKIFQEGRLDSQDMRKLERLEKEIRIVKEAESKRALERAEREKERTVELAKYGRSEEGVKEKNLRMYGKSAKASVYYDEVMNPFGAPPPGKPAIFYTENGGTTMDVRLAVVPKALREPGDEDGKVSIILEQGESQSRQLQCKENYQTHYQQQQQLKKEQKKLSEQQSKQLQSKHQQQFKHQQNQQQLRSSYSPNVPPPPLPPPPLPPPLAHNPTLPPPPPPPSKAVQRTLAAATAKNQPLASNSKSRITLTADIWASHDEIVSDFDGSLEGVALPESKAPINNPTAGSITVATQSSSLHSMHENNNNPYPSQSHRLHNKRQQSSSNNDIHDPLCPVSKGYTDYRSTEQLEQSRNLSNQLQQERLSQQQQQKHHEKESCKPPPPPPPPPPLQQPQQPQQPQQVHQKLINSNLQYQYIDKMCKVQGPFSKQDMSSWINAGFFPPETPVRRIELNGINDQPQDFTALSTHQDFVAILQSKDPSFGNIENDIDSAVGNNNTNIDNSVGNISMDVAIGAYPTTSEDPALEYSQDDDCFINQTDEDISYPEDLAYPLDSGGDETDAKQIYIGETPASHNIDDLLPPQIDHSDDENANPKLYKNHQVESSLKPLKKKYDGDKDIIGFVPSHLKGRKKHHLTKPNKKVESCVRSSDNSAAGQLNINNSSKNVICKQLERPSGTDEYEKFMHEINSIE